MMVGSYFITCAPIMMELLKWAERRDNVPIRADAFSYAVSARMTEEQASNLQTQVWGFLGAIVSGSAETMFKRADDCVGSMNGIDAWGRPVRHVDHGTALRLDDLRHEMKLIHLKPIKTIAEVEQGVAAFENSVHEFTQAGGVPPSDDEMKNDLLRMLPERMQLDLMWQSADKDKSFAQFRDIVVTQSARIINVQRPQRGIHQSRA